MTDLITTAQEIQSFCERQKWQFCFIGGLALQMWGEQRLTKDVDLSLFTDFGFEEKFIDLLLESFTARRDDAKDFALANRVVLLQTSGGIGIDISLGGFPFELEMINRAEYEKYLPDICLKICTAEDLIVLKAFADRDKDWNDIKTVIIKQKQLDWDYINVLIVPLAEAKYEPEIISKLEKLRHEISK